MNLFSTDVYLSALAEVCFPRRACSPQLYSVGGKVFRLLQVDGKPVTRWPFLDFVQPLENGAASGAAQPLPYLPRAVLQTTPSEPRVQPAGTFPSPFIDWSGLPTWEAFEAHVGARIKNLFPDSRRRKKKLERDVGPVQFVFDDRRPEPFERCLAWKSSQYVASGLQDMFADPLNGRLFKALWERGAVVVSTLSAGDSLLAVHLGGFADGRLYWWVPAYDPAFGKYSPGRLMLEALMEESCQRRHGEFDFLIGDETYKWHYATHNRVIGELGEAPLSQRLVRAAKTQLKQALGRSPKMLTAAQTLAKRGRDAASTLRRLRNATKR